MICPMADETALATEGTFWQKGMQATPIIMGGLVGVPLILLGTIGTGEPGLRGRGKLISTGIGILGGTIVFFALRARFKSEPEPEES